MTKRTIIGITAAVLIGIVHGLCESMYRLAIDQDTGTPALDQTIHGFRDERAPARTLRGRRWS